jgi:hypothetical protein
VLTGGSAVAQRRQGVAGDLEGVTGKVPGKEERTGAHRNGGSTVRSGLRWLPVGVMKSCSSGEVRE